MEPTEDTVIFIAKRILRDNWESTLKLEKAGKCPIIRDRMHPILMPIKSRLAVSFASFG